MVIPTCRCRGTKIVLTLAHHTNLHTKYSYVQIALQALFANPGTR
jgi:hypothetical protein